jgi:hypothetical protein
MFHDTAAELHLATTQLSHPIYAFPPYLPPADLHLFREIACDLLYKCNSLAQFIAQDASMRVDYIIYFLSFSTDPHNYLSGSQLPPETLEKTYGVFIIVLLCRHLLRTYVFLSDSLTCIKFSKLALLRLPSFTSRSSGEGKMTSLETTVIESRLPYNV